MTRQITVAEGLATRRDNFLWLRIVAALLVIYGHSLGISPHSGWTDVFGDLNWGDYSGSYAVDIFFVVSGFMVSGSYMRRSNFIDFAKARVLRIVPALLVCLVLTAFVIGPFFTTLPLQQYFSSRAVIRYIAENMRFSSTLDYSLPGVFQTNTIGSTVNGSLWTLPAEFHMYLFVAIVGAVGVLSSRKISILLICGLIAAGIFLPELLPLNSMWLRLSGYFVLGMLVQIYKEKIQLSHVAMFALVYATYLCRRAGIYPYIFAVSLAYFCFWFGYCLKLPSIEKFGDPSYGIYLWGWPLLQMCSAVFPNASLWLSLPTCMILSLILGFLSWHFVERQALRLKSARIFYRSS